MFLSKKLYLLLLGSMLLAGCALPPERKTQNAMELAKQPTFSAFQDHAKPTDMPIVELPSADAQPLQEINQTGNFPMMTTLSDTTLKTSDINLSDNAPIQLDFEQVSLRQIIEIIGDHLNISMVIDPSIGDKVTLRTSPNKPLTKKDLWPLLQLLLNDAGITMERRGSVYHLKKTGPTLPGAIGTLSDALTSTDAPEALQITPLRYISIESAVTALNPLVQPRGRVISLPSLNVIGIIATPQRLERVNKLLAIIDADPFLHRGIRLFRLANSKASEVQTELDNILKAISGSAAPAYQTVALERSNAILVVAPPGSGFEDIALWVNILDERSEESGEQVFIYRVRNLEATKLASTLSDVFKIEDKKAEEEKEKRRGREEEKQPLQPPLDEGEEETAEPAEVPTTPSAAAAGNIPISAELKVNIVADESTNSLLIRAKPRDYRQLLETIYMLDQMPKEVMINMIIAEVTLTEATKFGIDWQFLLQKNSVNHGSVGSNISVPTGNFPGGVVPNSEDEPSTPSGISGFTFNYLSGSLNVLLNTIASTNDFTILARPSLLVRNNEEAYMNVGSNEPFLGSINRSGLNESVISQDVQYKDTGTTIKVTPRINDDGIINMKIEQELSQLGLTRTTENLQSFIQRKVSTSVVVRDGAAIVIGGLIDTRNRNDHQGIPVLKDVPVIGRTLFSSTDIEETRTELVLIIVPQIVNPELSAKPLMAEFQRRMQLLYSIFNEEGIVFYEASPQASDETETAPASTIN